MTGTWRGSSRPGYAAPSTKSQRKHYLVRLVCARAALTAIGRRATRPGASYGAGGRGIAAGRTGLCVSHGTYCRSHSWPSPSIARLRAAIGPARPDWTGPRAYRTGASGKRRCATSDADAARRHPRSAVGPLCGEAARTRGGAHPSKRYLRPGARPHTLDAPAEADRNSHRCIRDTATPHAGGSSSWARVAAAPRVPVGRLQVWHYCGIGS